MFEKHKAMKCIALFNVTVVCTMFTPYETAMINCSDKFIVHTINNFSRNNDGKKFD